MVAAGVPATTTVTNDPYTQWNTNTTVQQNNPFGQANGVAYDAQQTATAGYYGGATDYTQQPQQQPGW